MPVGTFPVILSIAHFSDGDQRVAFATIRFSDSTPVTWTMLTVPGQNPRKLKPGEIYGYGVDSGNGCFIDASAAEVLEQKMSAGPIFFETMIKDMERTSVPTWSWLDMPICDANLVTFSSGLRRRRLRHLRRHRYQRRNRSRRYRFRCSAIPSQISDHECSRSKENFPEAEHCVND